MPATLNKTFFLIALSLCCVVNGFAQEMEVPVNVQYAVLHKILAFDRNLRERAGKEIVIGILYQNAFRNSRSFRDELAETIAKIRVAKFVDLPIRFVEIDMIEGLDLETLARKEHINIFYLGPLRAVEFGLISRISRAHGILTFTGVPAYVELGLAVGVGIKGESPRIVINLSAAKAEGVAFDAQLLKLAKVIE